MDNEQGKSFIHKVKVSLPYLYYAGTLISLVFIMAQVFYARRTMMQTSEWEKAKITIENIERFQKNLSTIALHQHPRAQQYAAIRIWPDFTKPENKALGDTLRKIYYSYFDDYDDKLKDVLAAKDLMKSLSVLDAFAYPIIMGYANELGSFQNAYYDYISFGTYIMYMTYYHSDGSMGPNARLLYRLWKVRCEQDILKRTDLNSEFMDAMGGTNYLLCFEGTEITPATKKQYEKKLKKELKKIQKEIEEFRKSGLK